MLRLRQYKSCDADLIAEWAKDKNVFFKMGLVNYGIENGKKSEKGEI